MDRAHEEGVERFTALVLAQNTDALRLLERLGDTVRHSEGSQLELEIELPARPESSAQLRLVLAAAARGLLVPAISMWRQVADFAHRRGRAAAVVEPANVIVAHVCGRAARTRRQSQSPPAWPRRARPTSISSRAIGRW